MTQGANVELTPLKLDAVAWDFLGSEFVAESYAAWPIDRRVDAYLRQRHLPHVVDDGTICSTVLERVMANLGRARRDGVLESPHR